MGRHRGSDVPATPRQRRVAELLGVAIGLGLVATVAGVVGFGINVAPSVQADELPQPPKVSEPVVPAAGPVQPIFDFADVTPWDPGKEPGLVVDAQPVRASRSAARVAAAQEAAGGPDVAGPAPQVPPNGPAPTQGDPLHDDGTFGDGCEQPGTPERCDPKPPKDDPLTDDGEFGDGCETPATPERCDPIVGLPPVIVEEPAEEETPVEETPVDEVEVVETVTEVAG